MKYFYILFLALVFSNSSANAQLFGGQIKTAKNWALQYPQGSVFCASGPTVVNDVTNPTTGKIWMDRNLGAAQVATSSTDAVSYGDLYQWGRRSDGHQCRTSATTTTLSSVDQPAHGNFILTVGATYGDWRNPQNNNLWQGVNGTNNPCPIGYRIPSESEWNSERLSWSNQNVSGAMNTVQKLPLNGIRRETGILDGVSTVGSYWTSTLSGVDGRLLYYDNAIATLTMAIRGYGMTIRCIKDIVGSIGAINCGTATNSGTLTSGTAASGVSSSVPYTGGNGGTHNGQIVTSTGVTGLTATLAAGTFAVGAGSMTYTITGTPNASGTASFALNIGGKTCTLTRTVNLPVGTITTLSCGTATNTGTLTAGMAASGVSSSVPYTGGNGGTHNGQTVTSTGVTGLTATLTAGVFANGTGNLTYTITGTPSASGTASFALNIGGKTCTLARTVQSLASLYPAGSVFCASGPTAIVDVTNPTTGKTWMDRNLGASQVATSSTNTASYGDLYQWGRRSDGHQCRTSSSTDVISSVDQPTHGMHIMCNGANSTDDWRNPQNNALWQGVGGVNNPCPTGYRLPTGAEFSAELSTWSSLNGAGAFSSIQKFSLAGNRGYVDGSGDPILNIGFSGTYWTSSIHTTSQNWLRSDYLRFTSTEATLRTGTLSGSRAVGMSVRCIKN
jgi:uncharacterized protein (TIGR02145 family)